MPVPKPLNGYFRLNKQSPQARGLIGWWPALALTNSRVIDRSAYHRAPGTVSGLAYSKSNQYGPTLSGFNDADTDRVTLNDIDLGSEFSIRVVFRVLSGNTGGFGTIFGRANGTNTVSQWTAAFYRLFQSSPGGRLGNGQRIAV